MDIKQVREWIKLQAIAPDDIYINGKRWKLESTYMSRQEAIQSAEMTYPTGKVFKYANGYANYERGYD